MIIRWLRMRNAAKTSDVSELQEQEQEQEQQEEEQQHVDDEREGASLLQPAPGV